MTERFTQFAIEPGANVPAAAAAAKAIFSQSQPLVESVIAKLVASVNGSGANMAPAAALIKLPELVNPVLTSELSIIEETFSEASISSLMETLHLAYPKFASQVDTTNNIIVLVGGFHTTDGSLSKESENRADMVVGCWIDRNGNIHTITVNNEPMTPMNYVDQRLKDIEEWEKTYHENHKTYEAPATGYSAKLRLPD